MRRPANLVHLPYREARGCIRPMDIGLLSGTSAISIAIRNLTDSDYSHAFSLGWCGRVAYLVESTHPESRAIPLSWFAKKQSGQIDVYRMQPDVAVTVDREAAWDWLLRAVPVDYPESWIVRDFQDIVFGRTHQVPNDDSPLARRVCSGLVHASLRVHGLYPLIRPYDSQVYPGHLSLPWFSEYQYTVVW